MRCVWRRRGGGEGVEWGGGRSREVEGVEGGGEEVRMGK